MRLANVMGSLCAALLIQHAVATPVAAPPAALTLETLLQKHIAAVGDVTKIESRRIKMRALGMTPFELPIMVEAKRPNLIRREVNIQGQFQITAYDGADAWMLDPFVPGGMKPNNVAPAELPALMEEAAFDGLLITANTAHNARAKGYALRYLGVEMLDERPVHVVTVNFRESGESTIYLDAATFLETRRVQKRPVMGREMDIESFSSDYRRINGVNMPHRIEFAPKGVTPRMVMIIESAELNVPLERSRFTRPAVN
jgi:hypothetical protein